MTWLHVQSVLEISSGRQALEGAAVAPGTDHTLHLLTDIERRPPQSSQGVAA